MVGRWIGSCCGTWLVACATSASAQLPPTSPSPAPQVPAVTPYDGATVPTTFNDARPPQPPREPMLLAPAESRPTVKLPLPKNANGEPTAARSTGGGASVATIFTALAVVLGLFLGLAALFRRGMPKHSRALPPEAVEMLGRIALPGRRQGHLIRVGNKISLISFSNSGADPLVEITDPLEVDRLAGLCKQADPHSATGSFRSIVDQFFREKPAAAIDSRVAARNGKASEVADD